MHIYIYLLCGTSLNTQGPIYAFYGENEGIVTPFYSNCNWTSLSALTPIQLSYFNGYPLFVTQPSPADIIADQDVYERHWVSAACYINLEPEWLQMKYYVNPGMSCRTDDIFSSLLFFFVLCYWRFVTYLLDANRRTIQNIPFGYKLNQFTINTFGSLASSLEFLYTSKWAQVYAIQRISQNDVIVSEVDILDGGVALFFSVL
jgi:hypothetical protein